MRRHLNPVVATLILLLAGQTGLAQELPSGSVNRVPADVFINRIPFAGELSVVGSDGIFYRVRHNFGLLSLPVSPAVVPPPPSSILEAIDLNPNSKRPVDSISFSGLASQLAIGKDNRLFLVINVTPPVSIATANTNRLVPVPAPQTRLYVIPTPFPPRALGATLESVAAAANPEAAAADAANEVTQGLDSIVRADFEGHVYSLKVKAVGDQEYLYLSAFIPTYRFPTPTASEDASARLAPIKQVVKLLIFNNNARKIKEVDTE
ncbi:MAG: hypothetical protein L0312_25890 [Acidobacteria bacterium]|nr:hypothetical protein [Acidobacteriota bacterium]